MEYTIPSYTLEAFSLVTIIVLIFSQIMDKHNDRKGKIFTWTLVAFAGLMISDTLSWIIELYSGKLVHVLVWIVNLLGYVFGELLVTLVLIYIVMDILLNPKMEKIIFKILIIMVCVFTVFILVSLPFGWIYSVSDNNLFVFGPLSWIPIVYTIAQLLLMIILVLSRCKVIGLKKVAIIFSYIMLMSVAIVMNAFFNELLIYCAFFTLSEMVIFLNVQIERGKKRRQQEQELLESRVQIMFSQIQPHFLYNSLVAIENLCVEDPSQAREAVSDFSKYLRGNLDSINNKKLIPFEQELKHVQSYMALEQRRYGEELKVRYEIEVKAFLLPALTIQPIMENAVRHGFFRKIGGCEIILRTIETETGWEIIISDNGVGFQVGKQKEDNKTHIGIENVRGRLAVMCRGTVKIDSEVGVGTTVTICIPRGE